MPKGVYKRKKKEDDAETYPSLSPSVSCSETNDEYYEEKWFLEPVFLKRWHFIIFFAITLLLIYSQEIYNFIKRINITIN